MTLQDKQGKGRQSITVENTKQKKIFHPNIPIYNNRRILLAIRIRDRRIHIAFKGRFVRHRKIAVAKKTSPKYTHAAQGSKDKSHKLKIGEKIVLIIYSEPILIWDTVATISYRGAFFRLFGKWRHVVAYLTEAQNFRSSNNQHNWAEDILFYITVGLGKPVWYHEE